MIHIRYIFRALKSLHFLFKARVNNLLMRDGEENAVLILNYNCNPIYWLVSDPGLKDRIIYDVLRSNGFAVAVRFNPSEQDLQSSDLSNKAVFFNPHHFMFSAKRRDDHYLERLHRYCELIDDLSEFSHPSKQDIKFWENKAYLHEVMARVELRHPKTLLLREGADIDNVQFPTIVKSLDGYSSNGLWKIDNPQDLEKLLCRLNVCLLQEFLNITFDIRVIVVNGVVLSFYWRINPASPDWKPTATQNGATVRFYDLPQSVENLAVEIYNKTGCKMYGADICFKNDDLESAPYLLEFSPVFQPNPQAEGLETQSYSEFKGASPFLYDRRFEELNSLIYQKLIIDYRKTKRDF